MLDTSRVTAKRYHHGHLRAALLRASLALIREAGIRGFTLREVARRARVSHNAPYRHFRDKNDLLAAIAEEGFNRLTRKVGEAASAAKEPLDRLRLAGIAYVDFGLDRPEELEVMFSVDLDASLHRSARMAANASFEALLALVIECQRAGFFLDYQPQTAARIAWAHVHGIAVLANRGRFGFATRKEVVKFAAIAARALVAGMAGKSRSRHPRRPPASIQQS